MSEEGLKFANASEQRAEGENARRRWRVRLGGRANGRTYRETYIY